MPKDPSLFELIGWAAFWIVAVIIVVTQCIKDAQ